MINLKYSPYLAGIGAACIFGFSFLMTKNALEQIEVFHFIALRFQFAALLMTVLTALKIIKISIKPKDLPPLILIALAQPVCYFIFETFGIKYTSSSEAGLLIALIPIAATILSALILKEYTTIKQLFFILLSISGIAIIILAQSSGNSEGSLMGYLLLIGAVFSAGFYTILSRKSSTRYNPIEITFVMMWTGAIIFTILASIQLEGLEAIGKFYEPVSSANILFAILYLGGFSSVLAFFFINFALSKLPATQTTVLANLTTLIAVCAGVVFRNEPFYWFHLLGTIFILTGVWGTNVFVGKRRTLINPETKVMKA